MLVLYERDDLRGIGPLEEVERHNLERLQDPIDDASGAIRPERGDQQLFGGIQSPLRDELLRHAKLMELFDDRLSDVGRNLAHLGDLDREAFDFILRQVLVDTTGPFGSNGHEPYGGRLAA